MKILAPEPFLVLGIFFLGACGKSQEAAPVDDVVEEAKVDPAFTTTTPLDLPASKPKEPPSKPITDQELQAEIDALLYDENKEQKDLAELLMDPRIMDMMANLFEQDWNPDPAKLERFNQRLMSTMQTVSAAGMTPGVDAPQTNAELDEFMGKVSIGTNDPDQVRELLGYVLLQDPEGFLDAFLAMTEDAAVKAVIDPEAKSDMTIKVQSQGEGE